MARQGPPWESFLLAYQPGDDQYRGADRPVHITLATRNTGDPSQTIDFPAIPDQHADDFRPIALEATASSGLRIQYWVVSGPYDIDGNTLYPQPNPARTHFTMRVIVAAYQWGRSAGGLESAGPVYRHFFIQP